MLKVAYLFPLVVLINGLLISNDIYTPSRHSISGTGMIVFGLLLLLLLLLLDYLNKNYPEKMGLTEEYIKKIEEEKNTPKSILDYIAITVYIFGIIYIALYIFGIARSNLLFMFFVLSFVFFGSRIRRFF